MEGLARNANIATLVTTLAMTTRTMEMSKMVTTRTCQEVVVVR
jgi:hypothetical protein